MPIDPIPPSVYREAAPYSLPQVAATGNDREAQAEGQPPLAVSAAERQVLRWMHNHLPPASHRRSRTVRKPGLDAVDLSEEPGLEAPALAVERAPEPEEAPPDTRISVTDGGDDSPEEGGTKFDVLL